MALINQLFGLLLVALPLLAGREPGQASQAPCQARLTLSQQGEVLHITGTCRSYLGQPAHYRYELRALRQGLAGQSRTTQGGRFELAPQQQVQLSQVGLRAAADDHYRIHLLVFDDTGRAVAQDSLVR